MPDLDDTLVWKGAWAAGIDYVELDAVLDGFDVAYVCIADHTSSLANRPPEGAEWELLVDAPASNAYASVIEIRQVLKTSSDALDVVVARCAVAASRVFERETGQYYGKDIAPVARLFLSRFNDLTLPRTSTANVFSNGLLDLTYEGRCPGIADRNGIVIKVDTNGDGDFSDEVAWATNDYQLLPLQNDQGPEAEPYTQINIPQWSSKRFIRGRLIEVTAIFGWPAVPATVKAEIIELVGLWLGWSPRATGRMGELDTVISASPLAMSLVRRWRDAYASTNKVTF